MHIVDVRAVHPDAPDAPADWRSWLGQILVAVDTDDGRTGYGVGGGGPAGVHVVRTVLRETLLGQDAEDIATLWSKMYRATLAFGRKGLAIMAISGVDLALWDLRGKAQGKPIAEVLGGSVEQAIPTYTTVLTLDRLDEALGQKHQALKLHVEQCEVADSPDEIVRLVEKVRERVGPDTELMVDAFMNWDVSTTLRIARDLAPFDITWLEEPLPPDDLDGYGELAKECPIPIAGGEHEFTAAAFQELIERRLHAILQPDVCWCGGLTQLLKIYETAARHGLRVCPHRGQEVWALHAIAALDPQRPDRRGPLAESGRTWMSWVEGQPQIVEGKVSLSQAPGFGVAFADELWSVQ